METVEALTKRRRIPKWLIPAIGYAISAVSLIWLFSKFPFAQLGDHLRTMNWWWVATAVTAEIAVYFLDAWRWKVLLVRLVRLRSAPAFRRYSWGRSRNDIFACQGRRNHSLFSSVLQD